MLLLKLQKRGFSFLFLLSTKTKKDTKRWICSLNNSCSLMYNKKFLGSYWYCQKKRCLNLINEKKAGKFLLFL